MCFLYFPCARFSHQLRFSEILAENTAEDEISVREKPSDEMSIPEPTPTATVSLDALVRVSSARFLIQKTRGLWLLSMSENN